MYKYIFIVTLHQINASLLNKILIYFQKQSYWPKRFTGTCALNPFMSAVHYRPLTPPAEWSFSPRADCFLNYIWTCADNYLLKVSKVSKLCLISMHYQLTALIGGRLITSPCFRGRTEAKSGMKIPSPALTRVKHPWYRTRLLQTLLQ